MKKKKCRRYCHCSLLAKDPISWMIKLLGPVIMGVKPAEILSFPQGDKNKFENLNKIEEFFKYSSKINIEKFKSQNGCEKLFIYHKVSMKRVFENKNNRIFLKKLGYNMEKEDKEIIKELVLRMKSDVFPDEIGVFLGYPLKDVIGFFGHPYLPLTKIQGWRVYGDSKISDKVFYHFQRARSLMNKLVDENKEEEIKKIIA